MHAWLLTGVSIILTLHTAHHRRRHCLCTTKTMGSCSDLERKRGTVGRSYQRVLLRCIVQIEKHSHSILGKHSKFWYQLATHGVPDTPWVWMYYQQLLKQHCICLEITKMFVDSWWVTYLGDDLMRFSFSFSHVASHWKGCMIAWFRLGHLVKLNQNRFMGEKIFFIKKMYYVVFGLV